MSNNLFRSYFDSLQINSKVKMVKRSKSLAEQLIENFLENPKANFLDLGNCDLNDSSPELELLSKCTHLTSLSLGIDYYVDNKTLLNTENKEREKTYSRRYPECCRKVLSCCKYETPE